MTDDRDDLESAKDWLADLGTATGRGKEPPEDNVEVVTSGEEHAEPQRVRSTRRMLDRRAELINLDKVDKPTWHRWLAEKERFSLVSDGNEVAAISTAFEGDEGFGSRVRCRRTEVVFKNGGGWTISTHAPGPRPDRKRLGIRYRGSWGRGDRVVEVNDGSEQIAYLANPKESRNPEVKTADGQSLKLQLRGRLTVTGEALTISELRGNYVFLPTSPVPLEAALLYWHVMFPDFEVPSGNPVA